MRRSRGRPAGALTSKLPLISRALTEKPGFRPRRWKWGRFYFFNNYSIIRTVLYFSPISIPFADYITSNPVFAIEKNIQLEAMRMSKNRVYGL